MFREQRDYWNEHIRGPEGAAATFWHMLRDSPMVRDHRGLVAEELYRTLPIGFHGDGGAFSKQDSLFVLSWNSILGCNLGGQGLGKRFLFTIIRKQEMVAATLPKLFEILAWSCNALLTGITPESNWDDVPEGAPPTFIADRWRATLVQLRGDWEFYANVCGMPNWKTNARMCWQCLVV